MKLKYASENLVNVYQDKTCFFGERHRREIAGEVPAGDKDTASGLSEVRKARCKFFDDVTPPALRVWVDEVVEDTGADGRSGASPPDESLTTYP